MSKNIVRLISTLTLLTVACGGEVTDGTDNTSGSAGSGAGAEAQAGAAGKGQGGAGTGQAGTGTAGTGAAGSGTAGTGTAGASVGGAAGTGQAGTGQAGTGQAGTGQAGTGGFNSCAGMACGASCDPCPPNSNCAPPSGFFCNAESKCTNAEPACGPPDCIKDSDCPQADNGTEGYCVNNKCEYVSLFPCMSKPCGATCTTCPPGHDCPPVVEVCNSSGQCIPGPAACTDPQECKTAADCAVDGGCQLCSDGTTACPSADCVNGACQITTPSCATECTQNSDCPQPKGPCKICPDDAQSCPTGTCTNGQCNVEYLPACGGPTSPCDAVSVTATGDCKKPVDLGYYWDGSSCQLLTGCECAGDCDKLGKSKKQCENEHADCAGASPCAGKMCGAVCSTCVPGQACPNIVQHCDIDGQCKASAPACD